MPVWEKKAAEWMHGLLYILIFGIPLSGYLYSLSAGVPVVYLGIIPMPVLMGPDPELKPLLKALHANLNWVLVGAFFLHVLAALKHQFINRDDVMKRMWP
jgi:cytochrome b561